MGTNIAIQSESFFGGDKSWIGARMGLDVMRSISVDISAFTVDHVVHGKLPSGLVLGKITATGKYGPYKPGTQVNESASLVATGGSAGDFKLAFDGELTAAIAFNATAADVLAALLLLSNINPGDIVVSGGPLPTTPVVIGSRGRYADTDVSNLTTSAENVTGGDAVITITAGGGASAASDGTEVSAGHLFEDIGIPTALGVANTPDCGAALFWTGVVKKSKLPNFTSTADGIGELDSAAEALLGVHIRYEA